MPKTIKLDVFLQEYDDVSQLPDDSQELIRKARENCRYAFAPYSNFLVGAMALLENGKFVGGSNQENAASPCGLCAERVALYAAASRYPNIAVKKLAVTATTKNQRRRYHAVTPCGSCRQVISEYQLKQNKPIEIIMEGPKGTIMVASSIDMLLPFKFSAKYMDNTYDEI